MNHFKSSSKKKEVSKDDLSLIYEKLSRKNKKAGTMSDEELAEAM